MWTFRPFLLEEKKLVEGAQAAQEAKEEAEVTVRTKYDHEANKLLKALQGACRAQSRLPGHGCVRPPA